MVARRSWGGAQEVCILFYTAYIRSILDYACVWYGAANVSVLNQLATVQHKALKQALGVMKSTPNMITYAESGEKPLSLPTNLAVIALTSKYWNAKQLPPLVKVYMHDPPAHHGDCKFPTAHPFHKKYDDLTTPLSVFVPKYTDCPTHNTSVLLEMFDSLPSDTIRIYTDGSKMKEGTGYSQSVLNGLQQDPHQMRNYLLLDIVELVKRLGTRGMTVAFAWVKGHAKIQGNERVDTLAKAAITTGVEESRLSENDHIRTFKQQLQTQWRQQWAEYASSSHNVYCKTYPDVPPTPLMYKLRNNQNRSLIATMLRRQTQHARNPTHLIRLGIKNSPLCECGEVGTLNHIIFSCPQNNPHTQLLLTHLTAINIPFPTSLECLLAKPSIDIYKALFKQEMCTPFTLLAIAFEVICRAQVVSYNPSGYSRSSDEEEIDEEESAENQTVNSLGDVAGEIEIQYEIDSESEDVKMMCPWQF
ncbi:hypothetical protein GEV33_004147 [Tenebrio molitor]|uniref:RNase H type-1 domain-containing protein n=1 Tax=Tenebrio molitor TaxID=7067 RepID=A0A8J6HQ29_TENMO|nr:hypothetical protein GEV33_004147 [Tenebrio molitor]